MLTAKSSIANFPRAKMALFYLHGENMKKILLAVLLAAVAVWGYQKYQEREAMQLVERTIRDTSVRVGALLGYMRGGKGVTYGDFIKRADDDLKVISDSVVSLQVGAMKARREIVQSAVYYVGKSEETVRAAKKVAATMISLAAARGRMKNAIETLEAYVGNPGNEVARYRAKSTDADDLIRAAEKADADFEAAAAEFQERLLALSKAAKVPARGIDKSAYLSESDFQDIRLAVK